MAETRVALLLDCENASPGVLEHAMRIASSLGRVAIRRGYGNSVALHRWHDAMQLHGVAPCMQFQYVSGKNTADIELALDALELLLDGRAEHFLLVTSDSDFVGLCRKLQERGAKVHVCGETKTPAALRGACDAFHDLSPQAEPAPAAAPVAKAQPAPATPAVAAVKLRPRFVVDAVRELTQGAPDGLVGLSELGNHLRKNRPDFSHTSYGFKTLRAMIETYDLLRLHQRSRTICAVGLAAAVLHVA